ncbi:MAG: hypothetical protein ACXWMK_01500 [Syntrophales bacterium]
MMHTSRYQCHGLMVGLCVLLMLLLSCESKDKYAGVYKAAWKESVKQGEIVLELKENGDGLWRVPSDEVAGTFIEVPFAWYIKRGELRVNTRAGGVIAGKIGKDTIQMTLPGSKAMTFKKIP